MVRILNRDADGCANGPAATFWRDVAATLTRLAAEKAEAERAVHRAIATATANWEDAIARAEAAELDAAKFHQLRDLCIEMFGADTIKKVSAMYARADAARAPKDA